MKGGSVLTYEQAKEMGREACIDRIGRDFIIKLGNKFLQSLMRGTG